MPDQSRQNLALFALFVGAAATALSPIFVRLGDLEPGASAFHRMLWALPALWLMVAIESRRKSSPTSDIDPKPKPATRDYVLLVLCGLFFTGDLIALHWSFELTKIANAILFLNAQPIYVVFGAWILFGERPTKTFLIAVAVALTGMAVMVGESAELGGDRLLGDAFGIVAGLCYAGYILAASRLSGAWSSTAINTWTVSVACPCLLVAALFSGQPLQPSTWQDWGLMIALGVVSQAGGQGFIVWGMARLGAAFSSVGLLVAPIASAIFAWLFLTESVSLQQVVGMAVVLAGIFIANRSQL